MRSVELFAGCGGLALGLSRANFRHELVIERDEHAYKTLEENKRRCVEHFKSWPIIHGDVSSVDYRWLKERIDLVSGGPPCQPFSIGGKHLGPVDSRNMWPEAIRAVRVLQPKAFLFENVRGLLRPAFSTYLDYIKLYLSWPELEHREREKWSTHYRRLMKHQSANAASEPTYRVVFKAINTADYGAPQKRHRALMMGVRSDVTAPTLRHRSAIGWLRRRRTGTSRVMMV